jgi:hypothetical protein
LLLLLLLLLLPLLSAGTDMRMANYLLLALAIFQLPFSFWLAYRPV